ncbi:hypothetical protein N1851_031668 [Merluccius polli]|uniref:EF-hand domain-containing protein n=1 Tax=Merluccius polli TaxID=89951 RepID=A0AA47M3H6_MERPO|nr:hypothetical protein N1851_031668 [Merluccius polli]
MNPGFHIIEGDQTLIIINKHPHLLELSSHREKDSRVITEYQLILGEDETGMSCIRIQSHIYFILLDHLQFIPQLLPLHVQRLLQLIQGSPQAPNLFHEVFSLFLCGFQFLFNRLVEIISPLFNGAHQSSEDLLSVGYLSVCVYFAAVFCVFDLFNLSFSLLDHLLNFRRHLPQLGGLHFIFLLYRYNRMGPVVTICAELTHTHLVSLAEQLQELVVFLTHPVFQTVHRLDQQMFLQACDSLMWLQNFAIQVLQKLCPQAVVTGLLNTSRQMEQEKLSSDQEVLAEAIPRHRPQVGYSLPTDAYGEHRDGRTDHQGLFKTTDTIKRAVQWWRGGEESQCPVTWTEDWIERLTKGAASSRVDMNPGFHIIEGDQTLIIINKHPHLLELSSQRETDSRVTLKYQLIIVEENSPVAFLWGLYEDTIPVDGLSGHSYTPSSLVFNLDLKGELGLSCIRIQSHIYFILLDHLQFSSTQLLHLHVQHLLQLIQGSPQAPNVWRRTGLHRGPVPGVWRILQGTEGLEEVEVVFSLFDEAFSLFLCGFQFLFNGLIEIISPLFNGAHQSSEDLLSVSYLSVCVCFAAVYCVLDLFNLSFSLLDHLVNFKLYLPQLGGLHRYNRMGPVVTVCAELTHTHLVSLAEQLQELVVFLTLPVFQTVHRLDQQMFLQDCDSLMWLQLYSVSRGPRSMEAFKEIDLDQDKTLTREEFDGSAPPRPQSAVLSLKPPCENLMDVEVRMFGAERPGLGGGGGGRTDGDGRLESHFHSQVKTADVVSWPPQEIKTPEERLVHQTAA